MTDEPSSPDAGEAGVSVRRIRRRRSSSQTRRSRHVQTRIPFTRLRFARPRLPTAEQVFGLTCAIAALGLSLWAFNAADRAHLTLTQTRTLLAVDTRGAIAGRLTADRLAVQAQADTAQMMAAQESAAREAARASSGFGPTYGSGYPGPARSEDDEASRGVAPNPYGQTSYGATPYGAAPYGALPYGQGVGGVAQPAPAPVTSDRATMGYTLPQATPR